MWVDRIIELVPRERLVAIKNISMAEEYVHDHFIATPVSPALPVMPSCFILEGMAQSAGILVGHANGFSEKVILAKINKAEFHYDAVPGYTLRYTALIKYLDPAGASTTGRVELIDPSTGESQEIGTIDLMFSHVDNNMAGTAFPKENFVFSDSFKTLLRTSGIS